MRDFRSGNRSFGGGNRSGGSRFGGRSGGFGGGRGRNSGGRFGERSFSRGPVEMHDAICSKCKKECQVPFRPTGSKPVFCDGCFGKNDDSRGRFEVRKENNFDQSSSSGSSNELNQINAKLDKIIGILQDLELDVEEDEDLADELEEKGDLAVGDVELEVIEESDDSEEDDFEDESVA